MLFKSFDFRNSKNVTLCRPKETLGDKKKNVKFFFYFAIFLKFYHFHFRPGRAGNDSTEIHFRPVEPKMTVLESISARPARARKWKFPAHLGTEMTVLGIISTSAI